MTRLVGSLSITPIRGVTFTFFRLCLKTFHFAAIVFGIVCNNVVQAQNESVIPSSNPMVPTVSNSIRTDPSSHELRIDGVSSVPEKVKIKLMGPTASFPPDGYICGHTETVYSNVWSKTFSRDGSFWPAGTYTVSIWRQAEPHNEFHIFAFGNDPGEDQPDEIILISNDSLMIV